MDCGCLWAGQDPNAPAWDVAWQSSHGALVADMTVSRYAVETFPPLPETLQDMSMTHPLQPPGRPFTVLGAMLFSALVWTACTPSSTAPAPEPSTAQSTASESSTAQPTTPKPALSEAERARKSREAFDQIAKIWKGASVYFADPKWDPANPQRLLPCQYPNSVTCTPAIEACALPGKRYAYAPLKKDANGKWRVESSTGGLDWRQTWTQWASLSFAIGDPDHFYYYQYCFESSGTNGDAVLKITAIGDLDCDGVKSTFIREGWAAEDSRPPDKCVSAGFKDTQINPLE